MPSIFKALPRCPLVLNDAEFSSLMEKYLRTKGFDPVVVNGGQAALDYLNEHPSTAVVVASQLLPGIDGVKLAKTMHGKSIEVPILMISSMSSPSALHD